MPRTKSAKKALRQNKRRRNQNLEYKNKIKNAIKNYKKLIAEGKKEEATKKLNDVYRALDKVAKVKFIKKGMANRLKSRMAKRLR